MKKFVVIVGLFFVGARGFAEKITIRDLVYEITEKWAAVHTYPGGHRPGNLLRIRFRNVAKGTSSPECLWAFIRPLQIASAFLSTNLFYFQPVSGAGAFLPDDAEATVKFFMKRPQIFLHPANAVLGLSSVLTSFELEASANVLGWASPDHVFRVKGVYQLPGERKQVFDQSELTQTLLSVSEAHGD